MDIRRLFSRGKVRTEVRFNEHGLWYDAIDEVKRLTLENETLRNQLSEALDKIIELQNDEAIKEAFGVNMKQGEATGKPREFVGVIPRHGPGLSEAEDAMKDDGRYEFAAAFGAAVEDMSARLDKEFPASLGATESQKDPITGLVFNPDGWLRVLVQRGNGFLRVNLQIIDSGRLIGTATGSNVEETLGRIIEPSERHDVREVVWDYHTLRGK